MRNRLKKLRSDIAHQFNVLRHALQLHKNHVHGAMLAGIVGSALVEHTISLLDWQFVILAILVELDGGGEPPVAMA